MRRVSRTTLAVIAAGLLVGGLAGRQRFEQVYTPRSLCPTCHHDMAGIHAPDARAPHSPELDGMCHTCHVLGVEPYLAAAFGTVGLQPPSWATGIEDPVIAGQTCLGCHMALGRRDLPCELCHDQGQGEVQRVTRCTSCHHEQVPVMPHDVASCDACHLDAIANPRGRAKMLLMDDLRRKRGYRYGDYDVARTNMRNEDRGDDSDLPGGPP